MKKRTVLLTLISVFLLSAMVLTSAVAQPRIVGVNVGDWYKYGEIEVDWSSNDPNATIPLQNFTEMEWMTMLVEDISGTNVTGQMTVHFENGTEEIQDGYVDIDTGDGENATLWIISANLDVNDTIYSSLDYSDWRINETISRIYPDGLRNTNHLNLTVVIDEMGIYMYVSMNYYWDKTTGALVEMAQEYNQTMGETETSWSLLIRITESNVWVIPEFATLTSTLFVLIVLTIAITIYKRRLPKTPIH